MGVVAVSCSSAGCCACHRLAYITVCQSPDANSIPQHCQAPGRQIKLLSGQVRENPLTSLLSSQAPANALQAVLVGWLVQREKSFPGMTHKFLVMNMLRSVWDEVSFHGGWMLQRRVSCWLGLHPVCGKGTSKVQHRRASLSKGWAHTKKPCWLLFCHLSLLDEYLQTFLEAKISAVPWDLVSAYNLWIYLWTEKETGIKTRKRCRQHWHQTCFDFGFQGDFPDFVLFSSWNFFFHYSQHIGRPCSCCFDF